MKLNFDELENGMLSECAVFCEEEEKNGIDAFF